MRRVAGIYIAMLLFGPVWLFALGLRTPPIENRAQANLPPFGARSILDTEFYSDVDSFGRDNLPLRRQLVGVDAWIDMNIWDESPDERVAIGIQDWLYLRSSWRLICDADQAPGNAPDNTAKLMAVTARMLEQSGRDFAFTIAPNKASIHPEFLGRHAEEAACAEQPRQQTLDALNTLLPEHYVDLFGPLTEQARSLNHQADPIYMADDTHWTSETGMAMVAALVDHFDPNLWDPTAVRSTRGGGEGGLGRIIGLPRTELRNFQHIERGGPGPQPVGAAVQRGPNQWRMDANKPVMPGVTFVVGDSFMGPMEESMAAYSQELRFVFWTRIDELIQTDPNWLVDQLLSADRAIFEVVEREALSRFRSVAGLRMDPAVLLSRLHDEGSLTPRSTLVDSTKTVTAAVGHGRSTFVVFDAAASGSTADNVPVDGLVGGPTVTVVDGRTIVWMQSGQTYRLPDGVHGQTVRVYDF